MEESTCQAVAVIVSSMISNSNINVRIQSKFEEIGLQDKETGAYMTLGEVIDYTVDKVKTACEEEGN